MNCPNPGMRWASILATKLIGLGVMQPIAGMSTQCRWFAASTSPPRCGTRSAPYARTRQASRMGQPIQTFPIRSATSP